MKSIFKSKGIMGALFTLIALGLGFIGLEISADDIQGVVVSVVPAASALVLMWKRFASQFTGLDVSGWIAAIGGILASVYMNITGDAESVGILSPLLVKISSVLGLIISAIGNQVAKEKVSITEA